MRLQEVVKNELKVQTVWADDGSPGCSAKWHSSKDDVCWVYHQSRGRCPLHRLLCLAKVFHVILVSKKCLV